MVGFGFYPHWDLAILDIVGLFILAVVLLTLIFIEVFGEFGRWLLFLKRIWGKATKTATNPPTGSRRSS